MHVDQPSKVSALRPFDTLFIQGMDWPRKYVKFIGICIFEGNLCIENIVPTVYNRRQICKPLLMSLMF